MDVEFEFKNEFALVEECIKRICDIIKKPIIIPKKKWNVNIRYTVILEGHHSNTNKYGPK